MQSPDHHPTAPTIKLSPSTGSPMHLVEGEFTSYSFRNVALTARGSMWECPDTQQRYSTPEQVNNVLAQVHRQWREHLGIERLALQRRRQALGLSAAQASALLGFGINQYSKYEQTDKVPSKSNAVLLQLLMTDQGIAALVEAEAAGQALKPAARRRLQQYVAGLVPVTAASRHAITATDADLAGGSMPPLPELTAHEWMPVVRDEDQEQPQLLQQAFLRQQLAITEQLAQQASDYSYAMAA